jgi:hypothetical protein
MSPPSGKTGSKVIDYLDRLARAGSYDAVAGFFEDAKYPDGTSVAQTMFYNEHGTRSKDGKVHSKPRPALRRTKMNNHAKWTGVLHKKLVSGAEPNIAYGQVAATMAGDLKKTINGFTSPGNAPATIKAKGFDAPLRETKVAMRAVSHQVIKRGSKKGTV